MSLLHLLQRPGVDVKWIEGRLRLDFTPTALTDSEIALLRQHKAEIGGWLLLHKLWEAGYSLRLERSPYGPGYVILPTGKPTKAVDFPALFSLYDTFHDAAVKLLLEACQALKIDPTAWPDAVEKMAKKSADYPENPELCPD